MSGLRLVGPVLAFTLTLCAQEKLSEQQFGAYKGNEVTVGSVMNYCDAVHDSLREQQPDIFAELKVEPTTKSKIDGWREFASNDEWDAAGKPVPLAFVWNRDGAIIRVTIVANPPRVQIPAVARKLVDYCYGADSKLIRIRAVWYVPRYCEFLFPCRLISGREFLLGGQSPAVTDWVFTTDGRIKKLRNGKARDDYFDPSNSLSVSDLHLRKSDDLPFNHLARKEQP